MVTPSEGIKAHTDNLTIRAPEFKIKLTDSDKELLNKLDMEHRAKLTKQEEREKAYKKELEKENVGKSKVMAVPNPKSKQKVCVLNCRIQYYFIVVLYIFIN